MKIIKNQDGIAIILALVMLLVMSVMAVTIAFVSNINFLSMSNFNRGEESFLAAENCVMEGRGRYEIIGVEELWFKFQSSFDQTIVPTDSDFVLLEPINSNDNPNSDPSTWNGPSCRSGPRILDPSSGGSASFVSLPPSTKSVGRPPKNTSLASGGQGSGAIIPITFTVIGKDAQDKDKNDSNLNINTGTEIAAGFETFIPGGATNVY